MKNTIRIGFFALLTLFVSLNVFAQKKPSRTKKTPATSGSSNPFGNPTPSSGSNKDPFGGGGSKSSSSKPANKDPFGAAPAAGGSADPFSSGANGGAVKKGNSNIPLLPFEPSKSGNPLTDSAKVSLRNDNIIETNLVKDRTPLSYDHIREDDAVYKQRFWRIIDAREKANQSFKYSADNNSQLFFVLLFKAVSEGGITAFEDEFFRTPYTKEKFVQKFSGGMDTVDVTGLDGEISGRRPVQKDFPYDSIYQFQIKDETVFDKESSRLITRILGIAPMGPTILPSGKIIEGPPDAKFWIYYPDIRAYLSRLEVYNPKNFGNRMSWEDIFESRMFSSYVIKSTLDNPLDQRLDQKFAKNKILMFYEGEAIKEKVFNYEQDLWSY